MPASESPTRYKFTPEQFHQLGELGLLDDENRYELLEGDIYIMPPEGTEHSVSKARATQSLYRIPLSKAWHIRVESPLQMGDSELIPDIAVVSGSPETYRDAHPTTALLVIEIAQTTLETDRTKKLPIYARAGVQECWILNLPERVLEVYREPSEGRYKLVRYYTPDETVCPLFAPDVAIGVGELLG